MYFLPLINPLAINKSTHAYNQPSFLVPQFHPPPQEQSFSSNLTGLSFAVNHITALFPHVSVYGYLVSCLSVKEGRGRGGGNPPLW